MIVIMTRLWVPQIRQEKEARLWFSSKLLFKKCRSIKEIFKVQIRFCKNHNENFIKNEESII